MMGFFIFLKHFRSTTGVKVACDFLHCNCFFFAFSLVMKLLWIGSFTAIAGDKPRKIAAFEPPADAEFFQKEIYRKFEKSPLIKRISGFWYRLRAVLRRGLVSCRRIGKNQGKYCHCHDKPKFRITPIFRGGIGARRRGRVRTFCGPVSISSMWMRDSITSQTKFE